MCYVHPTITEINFDVLHTIPLKHNVVSARARIIANKRGITLKQNACHASFINGLNTHKQNMCHAPLLAIILTRANAYLRALASLRLSSTVEYHTRKLDTLPTSLHGIPCNMFQVAGTLILNVACVLVARCWTHCMHTAFLCSLS